MEESIIVRKSRWRLIIHITGTLTVLTLVAASSRNLFADGVAFTIMAVATMVLASFVSLACEDPRRLVIDESGVQNRDWRIGILRWVEIKDVFVKSKDSGYFICFLVVDRADLLARLGSWAARLESAKRLSGYGDLSLNTTRLGISAEEVLGYCSAKIAKARQSPIRPSHYRRIDDLC